MEFKVGDRVRMSEIGMKDYINSDDNPHFEEGTIIKVKGSGRGYRVKWDTGLCNFYITEDLDILPTESKEEHKSVEFKVGDKVKLSESGMDKYTNSDENPHSGEGTVTELLSNHEFDCRVRWSPENCYNFYKTEDLSAIQIIPMPPLAKSGELATRHNQGKVQLSYILEADVAVAGACRVFEFGAVKYARKDWKKGLEPNEIIDSLLRHLTSYQNGEVLDPESGLPHVDHITCNALFLATFGKRDDNS